MNPFAKPSAARWSVNQIRRSLAAKTLAGVQEIAARGHTSEWRHQAALELRKRGGRVERVRSGGVYRPGEKLTLAEKEAELGVSVKAFPGDTLNEQRLNLALFWRNNWTGFEPAHGLRGSALLAKFHELTAKQRAASALGVLKRRSAQKIPESTIIAA